MIEMNSQRDAWSGNPTVDVRWPRPDVAQVVIGGEHDMWTKDQLDATLATTLANCSHLVVDLSTTQFIDSAIIGVLIANKKRADASDRRFNLLLGTEPAVERILEVTGMLSVLNRVHTLEEAIPNEPGRSGPAGTSEHGGIFGPSSSTPEEVRRRTRNQALALGLPEVSRSR